MDDNLTPIKLDEALSAIAWHDIGIDEVEAEHVMPLTAKPATNGKITKYQAGVKIASNRWRWSRSLYDTPQAAETEARAKAKELRGMK